MTCSMLGNVLLTFQNLITHNSLPGLHKINLLARLHSQVKDGLVLVCIDVAASLQALDLVSLALLIQTAHLILKTFLVNVNADGMV